MSDRVIQLIDTIKEKAVQFHTDLQSEKKKNAELESKLSELNSSIAQKQKEIQSAESRISELLGELKTLKEQKVETPVAANDISNEEIDELVKEIEFCIAQLKQ